MKRIFSLTILVILFCASASAQQALWGGAQITSPEVNSDKTVTFRFQAPDAKEVKLTGDWMPSEGWVPGSELMIKDDKGVWSFTTKPLESDLYGYAFLVDGLRSTDPNNPFLIRDVASVTNVFIVGGGKGDLYSVNDVLHGSVIRRWYDSPSLKKQRRITIYTPPGYESSTDNYPVLYLLHGAGGDEEAWINLGRLSQIMDNLIAQGKAKPMIVVLPNGNVSQSAAPGEGLRGFYKPQFMVPNTMDGNYEASFPDIMKFVESNYRVKTDNANRAIAGLSMGGFHSLHISRYYPNTFDYVGLFSAAILPNQDVSHEVYNDIDGSLEKQMENGYKLYWIGMGKTDFLYKSGEEYRSKLDNMGMKYNYVETDGGHTWTNWRVYLSQFAPMLFK
ncbi:esterase [Gaoshiqia sediminis]|uniref:Alpha/beta hydrolase-fold protein n=1 Tax=Gaoshiqia sediminis TaxID=2986998 RepID=A0AA42C4S1_9BACT|nr:esterase [Gaoshiqia sediminis]MCW0482073.1 alpha/beta hydrolase-fold protein [Gaoshiqia sediminis]